VSFVLALLACATTLINATRTVDSFLSNQDHQRLQQIFRDGLKSNDLQSIFYSIVNSKSIPAEEKTSLCKKIAAVYAESKLNVSIAKMKRKRRRRN